ncbi:MAG: hypothetical protein AB3N64_06370 [Puniceicoccaceae bacterium]
MQDTINQLIYTSLADLAEDFDIPGLENPDPETRLYGQKSVLDSMALVALVADLEGRVREAFGKDVILADERAMSRRLTPFARVGTLADYIEERLKEES